MQEKLMVEAIFLLGEGLFAPRMIDSWQLVAISRNAMYLSCNECIKSRTALHRNTIIASLTAKLKKAHARVYVYFYKQLASRQGGNKILGECAEDRTE